MEICGTIRLCGFYHFRSTEVFRVSHFEPWFTILKRIYRFGDIVTCAWWDDTWLNEGFAEWYGYDAAHIYFPEYDVQADWIEKKIDMMVVDSSIYTTSVIGTDVQTVSDILSMFGDLQYVKGGAILNMMQYVMGNSTYNEAVRQYIDTHAYINAESADLFAVFNDELSLAGDMTSSYVSQPGLPIVFVSVEEQTDDMIQFKLTQQRFVTQGPKFYDDAYFDPEGLADEFAEQNWYIHTKMVTAVTDSEYNGTITNETEYVEIARVTEADTDVEYYLFNNEFKNYYIVSYDEASFQMILDSFGSLSHWNQNNIIVDRFMQMRSNYVSASSFLELTKIVTDVYYASDDMKTYDNYLTYSVWNTLIESLNEIDDKICNSYGDNLLTRFRAFARTLLRPLYEDLNGYNLDNAYDGTATGSNVVLLRNEVIVSLVRFKDAEVINIGYDLLNGLDMIELDDTTGYISGIDADITRGVIHAAMAKLDVDILNKLILFYPNSGGSGRRAIRESFGNLYGSADLLEDVYSYILRGDAGYDNVTIDFGLIYWQVNALKYLSSCTGINYVWSELTMDRSEDEYNGTQYSNDFQYLLNEAYYTGGQRDLTALPNRFTTETKFDEIYEMYVGDDNELNVVSSTGSTANLTLEEMASNIEWNTNNEQGLNEYLSEYVIINVTEPISTSSTEEMPSSTQEVDAVDDMTIKFNIMTIFCVVFVSLY